MDRRPQSCSRRVVVESFEELLACLGVESGIGTRVDEEACTGVLAKLLEGTQRSTHT